MFVVECLLDYETFFNEEQHHLRVEGRQVGIGIVSYVEGTGIGPYEGARGRLPAEARFVFYEQLVYDDQAQPLNASFMDYLLPTATDVPHIETEHIETSSPLNPLGVKGAGEVLWERSSHRLSKMRWARPIWAVII